MNKSIYVGPNNKKLGLRQWQIFDGGFPQHVSDLLKRIPALGSYFMPYSDFVNRKPPGSSKSDKVSVAKPVVKQGPPIANMNTRLSISSTSRRK